MLRFATFLLIASTLLACGGVKGSAGDLGDRTTYPTDNIGTAEGKVIANLEFQKPDGSKLTLGDIHKDAKNRVLLLNTAAGWCKACKEEQPNLAALHKEYASKGLMIVVAIFQDSLYQPATLEQTQAWATQYKTPFTVVLDAPFVLQNYYNKDLTPMNMLVDVDDMKILKITTSFDEALLRAVIESNLDL